jgi:hypothetical protein
VESLVPCFVETAVVLFILGFILKAVRFVVDIVRYGLRTPSRTPSIFPTRSTGLVKALVQTAVHPYVGMYRANPWMFFGHLAYHVGLFTGIFSHFIVAVASSRQLQARSAADAFVYLCTWTEHPQPWTSGILHLFFMGSLVVACVGISTPHVLSLLGKRGVVRAPYPSLAEGFVPVPRDPRWTSLRIQRKVISAAVLLMDGALLSNFYLRSPCLTGVHLLIFWTLIAVFPYTFLAHEVWRVGTIFRYLRIRRGILA